MADVFSKSERSKIMQRVKSSGNKSTEEKLIQYFDEKHITGWRRHYNVKGHPDFVFLDKHIAIFVDGCFWHGHDCRNTRPAENAEYWNRKRQKNIEHDAAVTQLFQERGWCVIRIWECELKKKNRAILDAKLAPVFSWAELHTLITIILPVRYGIQQSLWACAVFVSRSSEFDFSMPIKTNCRQKNKPSAHPSVWERR